MGGSCETQRKQSLGVKGRKLRRNESVWDETKSAQQKPLGQAWDGTRWDEMGWDEMGKDRKEWWEKNN